MAKLINMLMQRNDCSVPWGFEIQERQHSQQPLVINRVLPNAVVAHNMHRGDFILQIQDQSVSKLPDDEIKKILNLPLKEVQLIVLQNSKTTIMPHNPPVKIIKSSENISSKTLGNPPTRPIRITKPVENFVPPKKFTQEPIFNKPFYKPIIPPYKKSDHNSDTNIKVQTSTSLQRPKKIIREFKNNNETFKSYNFLNPKENIPISHHTNIRQLEKKKSFFENFNQKDSINIKNQNYLKKNEKNNLNREITYQSNNNQIAEDFYEPFNNENKLEYVSSVNSFHRLFDNFSENNFYTINYNIENIQNYDMHHGLENASTEQVFNPANVALENKNINTEYIDLTDKKSPLNRCFSDNFFNYTQNRQNQFQNLPTIVSSCVKKNNSKRYNKSKCDVIVTECLSSEEEINSTTTEVYNNFSSDEDISKDDDDSLYMYELINENAVTSNTTISKNENIKKFKDNENYVERNEHNFLNDNNGDIKNTIKNDTSNDNEFIKINDISNNEHFVHNTNVSVEIENSNNFEDYYFDNQGEEILNKYYDAPVYFNTTAATDELFNVEDEEDLPSTTLCNNQFENYYNLYDAQDSFSLVAKNVFCSTDLPLHTMCLNLSCNADADIYAHTENEELQYCLEITGTPLMCMEGEQLVFFGIDTIGCATPRRTHTFGSFYRIDRIISWLHEKLTDGMETDLCDKKFFE